MPKRDGKYPIKKIFLHLTREMIQAQAEVFQGLQYVVKKLQFESEMFRRNCFRLAAHSHEPNSYSKI